MAPNRKTGYKDVIALAAFALVFVCLGCAQQLGMGLADEQFYLTVAKRLLQGDRLFVDEWHLSQMFCVLLVLPCKLFVRLTGGAQGIVVFLRRLFLACQILYGGYVYLKLKKYGFPALLFTLAACVFFPYYTFSYYSFAVSGIVLILATVLTAEKPRSPFTLAGLGAVTALTVLAQPMLAAGYFAYTAQVFILLLLKKAGRARQHGAAAFPSVRTWGFITVGIVPVFAAFMAWLFFANGKSFLPLLRAVPELFTGLEYTFNTGYEYNNLFRVFLKLGMQLRYFGYVPLLLLGVLAVALLLLRRVKPALLRKRQVRLAAFAALCVCLTAAYLYLGHFVFIQKQLRESAVNNIALRGGFVPVLLFGFGCFSLVTEPKKICFGFLQTSLFTSVLVDFSSDNCICYGGVISLFPALLCARELVAELLARPARAEGDAKAQRKISGGSFARSALVLAVTAAAAACVLFWCGQSFVRCALLPTVGFVRMDKNADAAVEQVESGPFRGLYVSAAVKELCAATEADTAAADAAHGCIYVDSLCPMAYLYSQSPMGTYSSFYVAEDLPDRLLRFWELQPEKIPSVIYVPYYEYMTVSYFDSLVVQGLASQSGANGTQRLHARQFFEKTEKRRQAEAFQAYFDCEITEGEAGYIIYVNR